MNYTNEGSGDVNLFPGEACRIQLRQNGCMLKGSPTARHPVILNTSCELVHSYLFAYFIIK
jgi:hypothetical protein